MPHMNWTIDWVHPEAIPQRAMQATQPSAPQRLATDWFTAAPTEYHYSENYLRFREAVIASATPVVVDAPERILYQSSSGMVWENFSFPAKTKQPKGRVFNLRWSGKP